MDSASSDRPERRTAVIAKELRRFKIDLAALSETRLADKGQLKQEKAVDEPRIHGVGFAIKNNLITHLPKSPVGINEWLMTLRLKLMNNQMATAVSAYAPALDSQDEDKEAFYAALDNILTNIPKEDKVLLLRDFNARVGKDHKVWKATMGKEGVGNINSNGVVLLSKCAEHDLVITKQEISSKRNKFKTSWMHPRPKCWHLIDYVIVRAKDRKDVKITRAMTGADDCWTDHRLIHSIMTIRLMH
ncbi:Craniofacial development protein 2 [Merluccius polli]|uniref:Craniofacial development protein 2 n=1 Tax=Merluccius polli TaxID=89951 RepID=A0AA47M8M6_MERPO|nr:Craniofacial development protein 2 [Merluccius polli]